MYSLQKDSCKSNEDEESFNFMTRSIWNEPDRVWNTTELFDAYKHKGGTETNAYRFVSKIKQYMKDELYCFTSPGLATVIMHKQKASSLLKVAASMNDENDGIEIKKGWKENCSRVK